MTKPFTTPSTKQANPLYWHIELEDKDALNGTTDRINYIERVAPVLVEDIFPNFNYLQPSRLVWILKSVLCEEWYLLKAQLAEEERVKCVEAKEAELDVAYLAKIANPEYRPNKIYLPVYKTLVRREMIVLSLILKMEDISVELENFNNENVQQALTLIQNLRNMLDLLEESDLLDREKKSEYNLSILAYRSCATPFTNKTVVTAVTNNLIELDGTLPQYQDKFRELKHSRDNHNDTWSLTFTLLAHFDNTEAVLDALQDDSKFIVADGSTVSYLINPSDYGITKQLGIKAEKEREEFLLLLEEPVVEDLESYEAIKLLADTSFFNVRLRSVPEGYEATLTTKQGGKQAGGSSEYLLPIMQQWKRDFPECWKEKEEVVNYNPYKLIK